MPARPHRDRVPARRRERRPDAAPRRHLDARRAATRERTEPVRRALARAARRDRRATRRPRPDAGTARRRLDRSGRRRRAFGRTPRTSTTSRSTASGRRRAGRARSRRATWRSLASARCRAPSSTPGHFNAYARLAERDDIAFVLHLGDWIYEASQTPPASQTREQGHRAAVRATRTSAAPSTTTGPGMPSTGATRTSRP